MVLESNDVTDYNNISMYVDSLNEEALRYALLQLLLYPESKKFLVKCLNKYCYFYTFPLGEDGNDNV